MRDDWRNSGAGFDRTFSPAAPPLENPIPFGDLALEVQELRGEIDRAVNRVLTRGWFVLGAELEQFEAAFADYLQVNFAIGCGNGTEAITLALKALDIGAGDEVITVANTCVPTATGIRAANCRLKLIDCDAQTLQMDAKQLRQAITPKTRAVIPVHLYGSCADMLEISEICRRADVPIIEDCAQAHGAEIGGRKAGRWGTLAAWSFYPSKNLGAYGDGGAVTTDDRRLAEKLKRLRNYGERTRYYHDEEGCNSRLDELQAAILAVKLPNLNRWNERRRQLAAIYQRELANSAATIPTLAADCVSARHLFPVLVAANRRDLIREQLTARGIATQIHYPVPLHRQKAFADLLANTSFPIAERAAAELISLPLYPQMTDEQALRAATELRGALGKFN